MKWKVDTVNSDVGQSQEEVEKGLFSISSNFINKHVPNVSPFD